MPSKTENIHSTELVEKGKPNKFSFVGHNSTNTMLVAEQKEVIADQAQLIKELQDSAEVKDKRIEEAEGFIRAIVG